jgi:hypothetical protein
LESLSSGLFLSSLRTLVLLLIVLSTPIAPPVDGCCPNSTTTATAQSLPTALSSHSHHLRQ